jgi:branched-chain amino acid transport system permease protein
VTRGANGLTGIPLPTVFGQKIGSERAFYYLIYGFLCVLIVVALRLSNSKVGRAFVAIREDELAAEAMGVPTHSYKVAAFALAAAFAGIAGALYGPFAGVVSPDNFTFDDSVGFLCMSVVGGNRTIYGAVAGALALTLFSEALRFLQEFRLIVYGAILLFTVIFMPNGFAGLTPALDRIFKRVAGRMSGLVRTKRS